MNLLDFPSPKIAMSPPGNDFGCLDPVNPAIHDDAAQCVHHQHLQFVFVAHFDGRQFQLVAQIVDAAVVAAGFGVSDDHYGDCVVLLFDDDDGPLPARLLLLLSSAVDDG